MTHGPRVGLLGGTFDPIHLGHLAAARAAQQALDLQSVRFIPSARPPHRPDSPRASEYHRLEMIRRAICDTAGWEVSDLEFRRSGPSFTIDTLDRLRAEGLSSLQIFFITGSDAFAEIATWHRYPDVLDAAHFVVITRPGFSLEALTSKLPALADRMIGPERIAVFATPRIVLIATETPDVSSTEIRRRAAAGESLHDLVPPAVAAYIAQHHLYREAADPPAAAATSDRPLPPGGR
jgi:nicotinate-nucleotide adenylyltransferase